MKHTDDDRERERGSKRDIKTQRQSEREVGGGGEDEAKRGR